MRQGEGNSVANSPAAHSRGAKTPAEGEDAGLRPPLLLKTALRGRTRGLRHASLLRVLGLRGFAGNLRRVFTKEYIIASASICKPATLVVSCPATVLRSRR